MLTTDDRSEIERLWALYGHVVDERRFDRIRELFSEDVVYDVSARGSGVYHGPDAVAALWAGSTRHPLAHHGTNVVIADEPDADGKVAVACKNICVHADGTVHSTSYRLKVAKLGRWRIAHLSAELRSADAIPPVRLA